MINAVNKIVLMLMLAAALPVAGQQMIPISGAVRDEAYNPVPFHQVFMTASDSTLTRTFVTDEGGFFRDSLVVTGGVYITYLHFFTFDCFGMKHDTVVTNLNQMVFVEFVICTDTIPVGCSADFTYMLDSLSSDPNLYQFYDQSTGNIDSWLWDFGDGSFSTEQNPAHRYADSGIYLVCLTAGSMQNPIQCTDTYCEEVGTPTYYNLGGLVWAGDYPLNNPFFNNDTGVVFLYRVYQNQLWFVESKQFEENGYYWFANLLDGEYMLKVGLTTNSGNYSSYMPTYFGDQVNWDAAQVISLHSDQFENHVHLVPVVTLPSGTGIINGYLTFEGFDPAGTGQQASVILFNENYQPVQYTWPNPNGAYEFSGLPFGSYYVRADLAGRPSTPHQVTLTSGNPIASSIELIVNESGYFFIDEPQPEPYSISRIYPNPARDYIYMEIKSEKRCAVIVSISDITGRSYLAETVVAKEGDNEFRFDVSSLSSGLYFIRVSSTSYNFPIVRKFIK
jgi:hypothetical protein